MLERKSQGEPSRERESKRVSERDNKRERQLARKRELQHTSGVLMGETTSENENERDGLAGGRGRTNN